MHGNRTRGLIVQLRDRDFMTELATMGLVDREQARIVAGFGSTTRVNARLLGLTRAGFLRRFRYGAEGGNKKALYTLSDKGARLVDVPYRSLRRPQDKPLTADFVIEHQLAINQVYCALKFKKITIAHVGFDRWVSFRKQITPAISLIPDGYFQLQTPSGILAGFLEVDLGHERGQVWPKKVRNYLQLAISGEFQRLSGQNQFQVFVAANSDRRLYSLRKTVSAITQKIFSFATLEAIRTRGFFAPIWLRPTGETPAPIIEVLP